MDFTHILIKSRSPSIVYLSGKGTPHSVYFLRRKSSRGSTGTIVKRLSISMDRKGRLGSASSNNKVLRYMEFFKWAGENVPSSGYNILARCCDRSFVKECD